MSAITMRFDGFYDGILNAMTKSGLAASKTEAIRMSLFKAAVDYGLINEEQLLESLQAEFRKNPLPIEEIAKGIEDAKRKTIRR